MSTRRDGAVGLGIVLACVVGTMAAGAAPKDPAPPAIGPTLRQYRQLCYTDVVPLLDTEQLAGARLPFLDACEPVEGHNCDEYPVLTMYVMRLAAWISATTTPFYLGVRPSADRLAAAASP